MDDQQTREELNRRYWESDASVSQIADALDISRRALYDGIEPLPAGVSCPACGGMLGFRNRTAAENQEVECTDCGRELSLEDARGARAEAVDPTEARATEAREEGGAGPQAGAQSAVKAGAPPGRRRAPGPPEIEQERSAAPLSPVHRVPDAGTGMAMGSLFMLGLGVGALAAYLVRQRG